MPSVRRVPDRRTPTGFFVFEEYVDEAAFAAHRASPHFQEIVVSELLPRIASMERLSLRPVV